MEPVFAIERFCYLGNLIPLYEAREKKLLEYENHEQLTKLVETLNGEYFLQIIQTLLENGDLPRKDEIWFLFALYMGSNTKQTNKRTAGDGFANLAKTSEDFFKFAFYSKKLREQQNKRGVQKSVRRAICNWYEAQDINRFIGLLSIHCGLYGFTHRDIIAICHVNTRENNLDVVISTAFRPNEVDENQDSVIEKIGISQSMEAFKEIRTYKRANDPELMNKLVKEKKIDFMNFPSPQRNKIENWEIILPVMTYRQLLDNMFFCFERRFFENAKFFKSYIEALHRREQRKKEQIHPLAFLYLRNRILKQTRYSENVKQKYHAKNSVQPVLKIDKNFNVKLTNLLNSSFIDYRGPPMRTLIAINIEKKHQRQRVINQKQVSCFEAAILLALSYYKSQKVCSVYAYTSSTKLKKIEWKKNYTFVEACDYCLPLTSQKVIQRLTYPLQEVMGSKTEVFDLILIIVGSATYGNSFGKPDQLIDILQQYRKKKNPKAKVVILNLKRLKPALVHSDLQKDGILEACGLNENTIKVINAFATNHFN